MDLDFAIKFLTDPENCPLWDSELKRETCQFLTKRGNDLSREQLGILTDAILNGPPTPSSIDDTDQWERTRAHSIWLRLEKLEASGCSLPENANEILTFLRAQYAFRLDGDQSEEFTYFIRSGWGHRDQHLVPQPFDVMTAAQFREWVSTQQDRRWDCDGGWETFVDNEPEAAIQLLHNAAQSGVWEIAPWHDALSRLRNHPKDENLDIARTIAADLIRAPIELLSGLGPTAAQWLETKAKDLYEELTFSIWDRLWEAGETDTSDDPIDINTPLNHSSGILAGLLTDALASTFPRVTAGTAYEVPSNIMQRLDRVAVAETYSGKVGRTALAQSLAYLSILDFDWTKRHLTARMDPTSEAYEPSLWRGFLWSPRFYDALYEELKSSFHAFLEGNQDDEDSISENAVQMFVHAAVPPNDLESRDEVRRILATFDAANLRRVVDTLSSILENAGERKGVLWNETLGPWFHAVWPRRRPLGQQSDVSFNFLTEDVLGLSLKVSADEYPAFVETVRPFLAPLNWTHYLEELNKTDLLERHPDTVFSVMQAIIPTESGMVRTEVSKLLDRLEHADESLGTNDDFVRMRLRHSKTFT